MTKPTTGEIPPNVREMLVDYWTRREVARWTMTTKQDPTSPLDRLCTDLRRARDVVENYRDELVRATFVGASADAVERRIDPIKQQLTETLVDLLVFRQSEMLQPDNNGCWLIQHWKQTEVRLGIVGYAHLSVEKSPLSDDHCVEIPLLDVAKLSAIAVALKDAENTARDRIPAMVNEQGRGSDENGRDRATAWLLDQWRAQFPILSRRSLARSICDLGIEPGPHQAVFDRLRKTEKRRATMSTAQKTSGRGARVKSSASTGRKKSSKPGTSSGRRRKPTAPASTGR